MRAKPIIIANWKGYVQTQDEAKKFVQTLKRHSNLLSKNELLIAPPFTLIPTLVPLFQNAAKKSGVKVGAQAVSASPSGAHTGDVTAGMLKSAGASFALVGHSERRFPEGQGGEGTVGDSEAVVAQQIARASEAGLGVVLCVGERERDPAGAHFTMIAQELISALAALPVKNRTKLIVAYEPVWAIGKTAADAMQPEQVEEMVIFIRKTLAQVLGRAEALKVPVLYGGSVEAANAPALYRDGTVAGFLVGHASAQSDSFISILKALE